MGLCAAVPVIAATARALTAGWLPAGDQANIAVRAFDVLTSRTPLVGLHSDVSAVTHQAVYSLGPMLFWLLALPAHYGSPGTLVLTMALLNGASIVGVVVLARRRGGRVLMFITAVAVVLMARSLAPEVLHDVWNPSAGLFPFTLLIFLCWSLACGEYRLLPLTVLVASFVVQCQLAFVPPCVGLLAVGFVGLGPSLRSSRAEAGAQPRADARRRPRGARTGMWRWALAALLVAAVCWTPPLIDQIQGNPGNLTAVLRTAKANPPTLGAGVGWHAVVRAIGVPPWWLRDPASPWERKHEVRASSGAFATISTIVILLALLALAVAGVLRRQAELWAGALIALALCAGLAAVAASTPTVRVLAETLGYTMWWGSPAGMFVWVIVGWGTLATLAEVGLPRWRAPELASVAGVVALAGVATAVAVSERPDYHRPEYRPLSAVYAGLEQGIPRQRTVLLIGSLGNDTFRFKMAARFALVRRGIRPLSPGKDVRLGSWYEQDHRHYDCVVYVKDGTARPAGPSGPARRSSRARPAGSARPPSPGGPARLLASVKLDEGGGGRPVTVWSAPAGCPRQATGTPLAG